MAQLTLEELKDGGSNTSNQIGFFGLKNDNDEAIVRFMYSNVSEFELLTVHTVAVNGKYRKVNCIRSAKEPIENCPFCANNTPVQQRFFIKLIQYDKDNNGNIVPVGKIWERSAQFAYKLNSYMNNYGPLEDIICKIIRHGKPGDMKTEYEIVPNLSKAVYRDDVFVKDTEIFKDYTALGRMVFNKSYEHMVTFLNTGDFPKTAPANTEARPAPNYAQVANINNSREYNTYSNRNFNEPPVAPVITAYNDNFNTQIPEIPTNPQVTMQREPVVIPAYQVSPIAMDNNQTTLTTSPTEISNVANAPRFPWENAQPAGMQRPVRH